MTEISAKIITDSISPFRNRLTTMELVYPRFIHSEFMTHRVFSRNSASSRAIPVRKMLDRIGADPAMPIVWPAEQSGMQGGASLSNDDIKWAQGIWRDARRHAMDFAQDLVDLGLHKSLVNRIIEPWAWHTVIVSATEWENFFGLRCSPLAQPEIHALADKMRLALDCSEPQELGYGDWHLPYIQPDEHAVLDTITLRKVSAARCARVSYLTHDGVRDIEKDIELCDRLMSAEPAHASPLEHVATPRAPRFSNPGNFVGWAQFRHYEGE